MVDFENVNRVFILGAGFSKATGMPLSSELTKKLVDTVFTRNDVRDDGNFWWWFRDISERIKRINQIDTELLLFPDFEPFFEYTKYDIEYCRMQQKESKAIKFLSWIQELENKLVGVLIQNQKHADISAISEFSYSLEQNDVVLTFNYDTILETSLSSFSEPWNHGFSIEDNSEASIPILKLHGSIDWWMKSDNDKFDHSTKLFERTECDEVLYRVSDLDEADRCFREFIDSTSTSDYARPGIAGLGAYKPLSKLAGSGEVWRNANFSLKYAKEVYIIGWSASTFDTMARFYFCSMLNQREEPPSRIVVIDPKVGDGSHYRPVFGDVTPVAKRVEDVNWNELLNHN